jgi:hypothetical protein
MIRATLGRARPRRAYGIGIGAALVLGAVLGARSPDPALADPVGHVRRQAYLEERAGKASRALAAYSTALGNARDAGRRAAALVQSGDEPPEPALEEAATLVEEAIPEAEAATVALAELRGVAAAVLPGREIPFVAAADELRGIAGQLRQAAAAAEPVVERRLAATRTLEQLEMALAALDADDPTAALGALAAARSEREVLAAWDPEPATLPLWLRTTDRLIRAAEGIARAALDGDAAAADRAARRYAAAVEEARRADVSLALTLSEAADGLTATPMRRLATALAGVEEARAIMASLLLVRP